MRFTRRRWDAWCLGSTLILSVAALAVYFLTAQPKVLATPVLGLLLLGARLLIPAGGQESPAIHDLPKQNRTLILWCVLSLLGLICLLPFVGATKQYWPAWAIGSCLHLAVTLGLAFRADRARPARYHAPASPGDHTS